MSFLDDPSLGQPPSDPPKVLGRWSLGPVRPAPEPATLSLVRGNLAEVEADAVCVSTHPGLTLLGGTGGAILEAGGWTIRREADAARRAAGGSSAPLAPGSVVATSAGHLPHRHVLLCVASDASHRSSQEAIRRCTLGALATARELGARSLAFPVFGSGHAGFPFERALRVLLDALREPTPTAQRLTLAIDDPDRAARALAILVAELGPSTLRPGDD